MPVTSSVVPPQSLVGVPPNIQRELEKILALQMQVSQLTSQLGQALTRIEVLEKRVG